MARGGAIGRDSPSDREGGATTIHKRLYSRGIIFAGDGSDALQEAAGVSGAPWVRALDTVILRRDGLYYSWGAGGELTLIKPPLDAAFEELTEILSNHILEPEVLVKTEQEVPDAAETPQDPVPGPVHDPVNGDSFYDHGHRDGMKAVEMIVTRVLGPDRFQADGVITLLPGDPPIHLIIHAILTSMENGAEPDPTTLQLANGDQAAAARCPTEVTSIFPSPSDSADQEPTAKPTVLHESPLAGPGNAPAAPHPDPTLSLVTKESNAEISSSKEQTEVRTGSASSPKTNGSPFTSLSYMEELRLSAIPSHLRGLPRRIHAFQDRLNGARGEEEESTSTLSTSYILVTKESSAESSRSKEQSKTRTDSASSPKTNGPQFTSLSYMEELRLSAIPSHLRGLPLRIHAGPDRLNGARDEVDESTSTLTTSYILDASQIATRTAVLGKRTEGDSSTAGPSDTMAGKKARKVEAMDMDRSNTSEPAASTMTKKELPTADDVEPSPSPELY